MRTIHMIGCVCLTSCAVPYMAPRPDQPHAVLKVRRTYEKVAGTSLREAVRIDENAAYDATVGLDQVQAPRIDAVLVHPRTATFHISTTFFHRAVRSVYRTVYEYESKLESESYSCGTFKSPRTCTRMVTKQKQVPKQKLVHESVEVVDAACASSIRFVPLEQATYLLQYTFQDHSACSLACYTQTPNASGGFDQTPCIAAPPAG